MSDCHIGGAPIVGPVWTTEDFKAGRTVTVCEVHARTTGYGQAMFELLGEDHPLFVAVRDALEQVMQAPCPDLHVDEAEPPVLDDDSRRLLDRVAAQAGI